MSVADVPGLGRAQNAHSHGPERLPTNSVFQRLELCGELFQWRPLPEDCRSTGKVSIQVCQSNIEDFRQVEQ